LILILALVQKAPQSALRAPSPAAQGKEQPLRRKLLPPDMRAWHLGKTSTTEMRGCGCKFEHAMNGVCAVVNAAAVARGTDKVQPRSVQRGTLVWWLTLRRSREPMSGNLLNWLILFVLVIPPCVIKRAATVMEFQVRWMDVLIFTAVNTAVVLAANGIRTPLGPITGILIVTLLMVFIGGWFFGVRATRKAGQAVGLARGAAMVAIAEVVWLMAFCALIAFAIFFVGAG
jgi:hypothetical protein